MISAAASDIISSSSNNGTKGNKNNANKYDMFKFIAQVLILYIVIFASLVNLTLYRDKENKIWTVFLSSALGILVPNPQLKKHLN